MVTIQRSRKKVKELDSSCSDSPWIVTNSVEQFRSEIGAVADEIMVAIEQSVNRFFVQALQLDAFTMELEALPDAAW